MKNKSEGFSWKVKLFDCNKKKIVDHDVLAYKEEEIKKLKKQYRSFEEFSEALRMKMMSQYWSRCEYEVLLGLVDKKLVLYPWVGYSGDLEDVLYDTIGDKTFDWASFYNSHIESRYRSTPYAAMKIDVYDQLKFVWGDFTRFVWHFHHKYQRKK